MDEDEIAAVSVPVNVPEGFWQRDEVFNPHPYSPMDRSVNLPLSNAAFKRMCSEFGLLFEGQEGREIGGWYYFRLVPPGGKDRSPPPGWLAPLLIRIVPQIRSRINTCVESVRTDKHGRYVELYYNEWLPRASSQALRLKTVKLSSLSDSELDEHLSDCVGFLKDGLTIHFNLVVPWVLIVGEFVLTSRELLRWDDQKILQMITGLSVQSTEPSRALAELAKLAKDKPEVSDFILNFSSMSHVDILGQLEYVNEGFAHAFKTYANEYGARTLRYVLSEETLSEKPEIILDLVRDQMIRSFDTVTNAASSEKRREALLNEAKEILSGAPLEKFERVLKRAERAYPILEDSQFYTAGVPKALMRYAILAIGERLARKGAIQNRDDVFFLELSEAREAIRSNQGNLLDIIKKRKGELKWVRANPGPKSYGKPPGPPPSLDAFPKEVQFTMKTIMWGFENVFPLQKVSTALQGTEIKGVAASPGKYIGRVCVVKDESEFAKLRPGDVLVCPVTNPVWSVLFSSIGALVTDRGGLLSHPAIIAREYQIPAVVATGNATSLLRDGQKVTVEGDNGIVRIS